MEWFLDGLGTMLLGLILGSGVGGVAGWRLGVRTVRQSQRARDGANQVQIGHDQKIGRRRRRGNDEKTEVEG